MMFLAWTSGEHKVLIVLSKTRLLLFFFLVSLNVKILFFQYMEVFVYSFITDLQLLAGGKKETVKLLVGKLQPTMKINIVPFSCQKNFEQIFRSTMVCLFFKWLDWK